MKQLLQKGKIHEVKMQFLFIK